MADTKALAVFTAEAEPEIVILHWNGLCIEDGGSNVW